MASKDLHEKAFDYGTIEKLEIFEDYTQAWLPTFVKLKEKEIHIFDFFAGPGFDENGIKGSPIRILDKIKEQLGNILQSHSKIILHFNEFEPNKKAQDKFNNLVQNCNNYLALNPKFKYFLQLNYYNKDTSELFFHLLPLIEKHPSLVFLDQNGVKFISKKYIEALEKTERTDFLFFVSSSYFWRLGETEEFQKVLPIDLKNLKKEERYVDIHRLIIYEMKKHIPQSSKLKLFPFSIKKGANIFGILFGAKHYRAVDKFLEIAWKRNEINGEADFDIDEDRVKIQLDLFEGKKKTKIEKFKEDLESLVRQKALVTNKDILVFTYENGHIPRHAVDKIKELKKSNIIFYPESSPLINYEQVFKNKRLINIVN